jgi:hypothetical protein
MVVAAIVAYSLIMLVLFVLLLQEGAAEQLALRGEKQHQHDPLPTNPTEHAHPPHPLSDADEETSPIIDAIERLCGESIDADDFSGLLLDPSGVMGVAFMIFVAALLRPKIYALGKCATAQMSSMLPAKRKGAQVANQAINSTEEAIADAAGKTMTAVEDKLGEEPEQEDKSDRGVNIWFAYSQLLLLCIALYNYISMIPSASEASWECRSALFVSAPMAKTVSLPMWIVLLDVAQYSYWLLHRHETPKQQTGIPAPTPPLDSNYLTLGLMAACAGLFVVWFAIALPELLLLVAFMPSTLYYFVVQPVAIMVLLPALVDWVWKMLSSRIESLKDIKTEGVSGAFTIKIAAAQGLCSAAEAVKFLHMYENQGSYSTMVRESILTAVNALPRFVEAMSNLSLPSFSFPMHLPAVELELFKVSVFLALLAYGLGPFLAYYHRHLKDWGSDTMFKMEEVVLEVGEQGDDLNNQAALKKREFTGRQRLARYWNMFASKGEKRVAAHDLFTERVLSKRKQAFGQLDKDGDGYLTREELQARGDWLEALGEGGSVEWSALQGQGIQKEDIDKLLEKETNVRAGEPEFMPGEAVRVMGSSVGKSTAAEVVRRVGPEVDYYYVRTFSFRAWQPSWVLASVLVYGMMAPAMVLSAAQQLVVLLKNSVRRGKKVDENAHESGFYSTDEDYKGSMVFMGKEEKARHTLCKTKYLWLWQYVPFATPQQKLPWARDYGYVTAGTVVQFVRSNPGVKILSLDGCPNVGTEALAVVGTSCKALKRLTLAFCELTGTHRH